VNSAIRSETAKGRTVEGMDDQELFNAAMSDEAPATEPVQEQPAPEPAQDDGQPRDEHGRFAAKTDEVVAPLLESGPNPALVGQPKPAEQDAQVPSWRLRELREEREAAAKRAEAAEERANRAEAMARQLQARVEPPKTPDMYAEPEAWQQHLTQQTQNAILQTKLDLSESWARDKFGDEKVDSAIKWAEQNLGMPERMRLAHTRDPSRELVRMYDERQTLSQIGGNLDAYRAKVMDDALNDPAFMQKVADKLRGTVQTPNGQRPAISLPPSLNKATGSQVGHDSAGGSMSDADLYAHAIR
jgi:hypothetical protein